MNYFEFKYESAQMRMIMWWDTWKFAISGQTPKGDRGCRFFFDLNLLYSFSIISYHSTLEISWNFIENEKFQKIAKYSDRFCSKMKFQKAVRNRNFRNFKLKYQKFRQFKNSVIGGYIPIALHIPPPLADHFEQPNIPPPNKGKQMGAEAPEGKNITQRAISSTHI